MLNLLCYQISIQLTKFICAQVSLIETENETPEFVSLHITENGKKRVFARLHPKRRPQLPLDVVYGQSFQISHNRKKGSVYIFGYKFKLPSYLPNSKLGYPFLKHIVLLT